MMKPRIRPYGSGMWACGVIDARGRYTGCSCYIDRTPAMAYAGWRSNMLADFARVMP